MNNSTIIKNHRKQIIVIIALVFLGLILMNLLSSSSSPPREERGLFTVEVEERHAESYTPLVILRGVTHGNKEVTFRTARDAFLEKRLLDDGAFAQAGDIIAQLDKEDKEALLAEAQSLLEQRESELRASESLSQKGHRSAIEARRAKTAHAAAYARLQTMHNELKKRTITAPFDGIVFNYQAEEGQYLKAGDSIASIVSLSPLVIAADASEKDMNFIKTGQKARIRLNDGSHAEAVITYKAPAAVGSARSFRIEAEIPNDDQAIVSGFSVELIVEREAIFAHRIHSSLLSLNEEGQLGVKILSKGNQARFVTITPVGEDTDGIWITGLPQRITLITRGQGFVLDGAIVTPLEAPDQDQDRNEQVAF